MEIYSHPDIPEILSLPGNSTCCDCGIEKPKWASLNNGVFLCLKCAGIHRGLGVDISTIRSLQIDSWTDKQILYLSQGGNFKLQKILEEYGIDPKVVYPHSFRHRFAKNFLEKYNDIALLADLMGHESIETTRIYLRKTASEQQAIVDKIVTW